MTCDRFVEISPDDWEELRDLFLREWPRYEVAYVTVQNYIHWARKANRLPGVTFYSLLGNWREDGTILITNDEFMFIYTLDESLETLRRALLAFHWNRTYLVAMTCYRSLVLGVYQTLHLEKVIDIPNVLYYMPRERAAQFTIELPDGFTTGEIGPQHASFIDDRWKHKGPGTEAMIERLLLHNLSMGLYDQHGHLVGWCIRSENGSLSMLGVQTKRKGYASIVIKAFAKHLARQGLNAYACVITTNDPSRALFRKLAFTEVCAVDYLGNSVQQA